MYKGNHTQYCCEVLNDLVLRKNQNLTWEWLEELSYLIPNSLYIYKTNQQIVLYPTCMQDP